MASLPFQRPEPEAIRRFVTTLRARGVSATVRKTKGRSIDAACGQLRRRPRAGLRTVLANDFGFRDDAGCLLSGRLVRMSRVGSGVHSPESLLVSHAALDALERQLEARDPDVRLMLQVRDDVPGAFEVLVQRYQDRLVGILFHLVGNREEAEDLSQDTFLRIYKARKGYRPRAKFSTWLFTIANNLALNHLRGKGRNPSVPMSGAAADSQAVSPIAAQLASRESTASSQMRKVELSEIVREALGILNEDQKMAVLLNKFEDMSYAEIAEVMSRSPAAVKSLLARARNDLRERLEPYLATGQRGTGGTGW